MRRLLVFALLPLAGCPSDWFKPRDGGAPDLAGSAVPALNFTIDSSCKNVSGVDRTKDLQAAASEAVRLAQSGVTYFDNPERFGLNKYERWFGGWNQIVPRTKDWEPFPEQTRVEENVRLIGGSITRWRFVIACRPNNFLDGNETRCDSKDDFAWVDEDLDRSDPFLINICPLVFSLPANGNNSQASTIVHEVGHFVGNVATNDIGAALKDRINASNFTYDLVQFAAYSSTNPLLAFDDAYTHEFFLGSDPGR